METASPKMKENYIFDHKICWIITEGIAGTENQCLAVAEKLGFERPVIKRIGLKWPFSWLCPFLKTVPEWAFTGDSLAAPYPDLLIASGRKAIPASLFIKKRRRKQTFTVQIQDPRIAPRYFDLVAVPEHDPARGANVLVTTAAPTRIDSEKLAMEKQAFAARFEDLPVKRIAVLIGGNSKAHRLTPAIARKLFADLLPFLQSGEWGVMVTVSRRTPPFIADYLKERLTTPHCIFWDGRSGDAGANPYTAYLAHASHILVTEDSVSMISDAVTTGKPVYIVPLEGGSKRFSRFRQGLEKKGMIRAFNGELGDWTYTPPDDAGLVAAQIKKRFANRGQSH